MSETVKQQAIKIRDEVLVAKNTAKKVGSVLVAVIDEMDEVFKNVSDVKGLSPRGSYDSETMYERLDIIENKGNSYLVLQKFIGIEPEGDNIITMRLAQKGEHGKGFTYADFTPEQLAALKGDKGDSFTFEDFTPEQLEALKVKGDAFTYTDFTPEQLSALKGQKGDTGRGLTILAYYGTLDLLKATVTTPEVGDAYGVGTEAPYSIYVFDGVKNDWVNNGKLSGGGSGGDAYNLPINDLLPLFSLTNTSTSDQVIEALGGAEGIADIVSACKSNKKLILNKSQHIVEGEVEGKYITCQEVNYLCTIASITQDGQIMNILNIEIYFKDNLILIQSEDGGMSYICRFTNATEDKSKYITKDDVENYPVSEHSSSIYPCTAKSVYSSLQNLRREKVITNFLGDIHSLSVNSTSDQIKDAIRGVSIDINPTHVIQLFFQRSFVIDGMSVFTRIHCFNFDIQSSGDQAHDYADMHFSYILPEGIFCSIGIQRIKDIDAADGTYSVLYKTENKIGAIDYTSEEEQVCIGEFFTNFEGVRKQVYYKSCRVSGTFSAMPDGYYSWNANVLPTNYTVLSATGLAEALGYNDVKIPIMIGVNGYPMITTTAYVNSCWLSVIVKSNTPVNTEIVCNAVCNVKYIKPH